MLFVLHAVMVRVLLRRKADSQWIDSDTDEGCVGGWSGRVIGGGGVLLLASSIYNDATYDTVLYSMLYDRVVDVDLCNPAIVLNMNKPCDVRHVLLHGVIGQYSAIESIDVANMMRKIIDYNLFHVSVRFDPIDSVYESIDVCIFMPHGIDNPNPQHWVKCGVQWMEKGFNYSWYKFHGYINAQDSNVAAHWLTQIDVHFTSQTFAGCPYYVTMCEYKVKATRPYDVRLDSPFIQTLIVLSDDETKAVIMSANI